MIYHFKIHQIFPHKNLKMNNHKMDNTKQLQLKLFKNLKIQSIKSLIINYKIKTQHQIFKNNPRK